MITPLAPALALSLAILIAAPASAQAPATSGMAAPAENWPKVLPAPGGAVIIPGPGHQRAYDTYRYAPARRAGDFLYISGVIAGPAPGEARDAAAFRVQARRAFKTLEAVLTAAGASFADVVMINTFHVWNGPGFKGTRDEQFAAFSAAKDEVMAAPHPAWTAVGTTGLLSEDGVVEIQLIAYVPRHP